MSSRASRLSVGSGTVVDHWFAGLSGEKCRAFDSTVREMESVYGMLSVSLDEAFTLREKGALVRAREQVGISADLVDRLAERVLGALGALETHG